MCSEDKPDYKFLVFHPELILSVEFFHIVYDTPNPQTMSGTLCDRNSIREYRHYLHRIFTMSSRCPAFSDRDSSILRLLSGSSCTACMAFPVHSTGSHRTSFPNRGASLRS